MKVKVIIAVESIIILLCILFYIISPIQLKKEISSLTYDDAKNSFNPEMIQELEKNPIYIEYSRWDLDNIELGIHFLDYIMGFKKHDIAFIEYQIIDNKYCYVKKGTLLKGCASILYDMDTNMVIGYIIEEKPLI